jgi:hypothetical protein
MLLLQHDFNNMIFKIIKSWVFGRALAGIVGSNSAEDMEVFPL